MSNRFAILERLIDPKSGGLSEELARHLLALDFPVGDHARYEELSEKAQRDVLTESEQRELEGYVDVYDLLTLLQARARASLKQRSPAA